MRICLPVVAGSGAFLAVARADQYRVAEIGIIAGRQMHGVRQALTRCSEYIAVARLAVRGCRYRHDQRQC